MTATLFIRVTASIQGCLQLLLSSFLSFQGSIDLCSLCGREKKEGREGGREGGRKGGGKEGRGGKGGKEVRKEQTMEMTGLIKYDDSAVLTFRQIWKLLFLQNIQSLLHLPSSWEPYKGLRCRDTEMDTEENARWGTASCTPTRKFPAFISFLCSSPDSQVPTGGPFACRVCVTG